MYFVKKQYKNSIEALKSFLGIFGLLGFVGFYKNLLGFVRFCKICQPGFARISSNPKKRYKKIRRQKISQDLRGFGSTKKKNKKIRAQKISEDLQDLQNSLARICEDFEQHYFHLPDFSHDFLKILDQRGIREDFEFVMCRKSWLKYG